MAETPKQIHTRPTSITILPLSANRSNLLTPSLLAAMLNHIMLVLYVLYTVDILV